MLIGRLLAFLYDHASRHIPGGADPMRWTATKLLKGAGAGSDPTEVDPYTDAAAVAAVGGKIATGTYTGNGDASRQIAVGFLVYMVIVQEQAATDVKTSIGLHIWGAGDCIVVYDTNLVDDSDLPSPRNDDGFQVGSGVLQMNTNAVVYRYCAIG